MRCLPIALVFAACIAAAPALAAQQPSGKERPPAERQPPPKQPEHKGDTGGKKTEPEKPRDSGHQPAERPRTTGEPQLRRHKPS